MNIIIPMAGAGERFAREGYRIPKYLINVRGKTLLEWSLSSLPLSLARKIVFIGRVQDEREHAVSKRIKILLEAMNLEPDFIWLDKQTGGQAETVLMGSKYIDTENPLLIFNIDTHFNSINLESSLKHAGDTGYIGAFYNSSGNYSYAKTDQNGYVTRVAEKDPISSYALTGLYHFSKSWHFMDIAEEAISNTEKVKGEYYIAPLYNKLIKRGHKYRLDLCESYAILGTPDDLKRFEKSGAVENKLMSVHE